MKSLKVKLISIVSVFVLVLSTLIIGVWAVGESQHIKLSGSVNFTIADDTLYIRDIRVRDDGDLTGQGTTIDNFIPGFVNGEVDLNLGTLSADTSFSLIFDVVNTSTTTYEASTASTIPNATLLVSGTITGDGVLPTEVATANISGQIVISITVASAGSISLDGIVIDINEKTSNTVTIILDYNTSYYDNAVRVAINGSEDISQLVDLDTDQDKVVILNDIHLISLYNSGLMIAMDIYTINITSDAGFSDSINSVEMEAENATTGWIGIDGDVTFTITIVV